MTKLRSALGRIRLWHLLFGFLVLFGILPIVVSTTANVQRNRDLLEGEEKVNLSRQAEHLSRELGSELARIEKHIDQLGVGLTSIPESLAPDVRQSWIEEYLLSFVLATGGDFTTRVTFLETQSVFGATDDLPPELADTLLSASVAPEAESNVLHSFVVGRAGDEPWVVVTRRLLPQPERLADGEQTPSARGEETPTPAQRGFVLQAAKPLPIETEEGQGVFLLDAAGGEVLWSDPSQAILVRDAVERSPDVRGALRSAVGGYQVLEYEMRIGSRTRDMIGQLGRVGDTGWVVLVQKRKEAALRAVGDLVKNAVLTAAITVLLASLFGAGATRMLSAPIQELAATSHEIASGRFGQRVETVGPAREIVDLAASFNQMSTHVEEHVARLREAARVNRELFIGTIRALLAAVEAKEPYTRGHSERVASYSQAIAGQLTDQREFIEQLWIAGLLHDIGKIGIEDRVLNKGDVLTDEEFEIMKRHPAVGAEIMASIDQLKSVLPAIRWHHERWLGGGYPDGLVGEDIPLMARIVAVADTFDAVTTQRVYQDPYTPEQAVEIIRKLDGKNFDPRVVQAFLMAYDQGEIRLLPMTHRPHTAERVDEAAAAVHT